MTQSIFLLIAAIIPLLFGTMMMLMPAKMLANSLVQPPDRFTLSVTQWTGFGTFTVGLITFLARNDQGSEALTAIMVGNIVFHLLGLCFDVYHYRIGIMKREGLITGLLPHTLLIVGFVYYLIK